MDQQLRITLKKGLPPTTGDLDPANRGVPIAGAPNLFYGERDNPLLAPRGVCQTPEHLLVADTGQNRVFIWKNLNWESSHAVPEVVLGQLDHQDTGRNAGATVSASTLHYPSGIWSDGRRLAVADAWNHRVLLWHTFPRYTGQPADVVIGQPSFTTNEPNVLGLGKAPTARSLYWCYGVYSDGEQLWIADTGNRRILHFQHWPEESYPAADAVIGQSDFTDRDYDSRFPIWPYSVKVGPSGQLLVADTQYYRVLLWHDWRTAQHQEADVIIGQTGFDANGMNQYGLTPQANTLSWVYDACFYQDGLLVADTGNSRVLWFTNVPQVHNANAQGVIGKMNFVTGSENLDTIMGTEKTLYWPFSLSVWQDQLILADTGNHRILRYPLQP
ncbi:MAG: hypothetical protein H6555_02645 [Lewinellaceae bacterium]|nr:hypothetical protein [Lewinellaceae bacterium]